MAKVLDIILIAMYAAFLAGSTIYKLLLWYRYRHDAAKREALVSWGQVYLYPKWMTKFIFDEGSGASAGKCSVPKLARK